VFLPTSDGSDSSSQTPQLVLNFDFEVAFEVPDQSHKELQIAFDH